MKKCCLTLLVLLVICFALIPTHIMYANVIFEPRNGFYRRNENNMEYLGRGFIANGTNGVVEMRNAPSVNRVTATVQNGEAISIEFTCLYAGEYWGYGYAGNRSGWVRMNHLYGSHFFEQENRDKFIQYNIDSSKIEEMGSALIWRWPGTDIPPWTLEDIDLEMFHFGRKGSIDINVDGNVFVDEQGGKWGQVVYYFGSMDGWVYLNDPMNSVIPEFSLIPNPPIQWIPHTAHTEIPSVISSAIAVVIILVAVIAIGTVVMIKVLYKKKGKEDLKNEKIV